MRSGLLAIPLMILGCSSAQMGGGRVDPVLAALVPADALSGFALSHAINSARSLAGTAVLVTITSGLVASSATGSKSFNRS